MNPKFIHIIGIIIKSDRNSQAQEGKVRIFPLLRLLAAILTILLCALSKNALFTVTVISVELLRTALLSADQIRRVIRPVLTAAFFTALIMLPAVFMGYPSTFGTVTMKVFESVMVLALLNEKVAWKDMTGAFASLHLPSIFIYTLDSTIRYLFILGCFLAALSEAVWLRTFGKTNWRKAGTGGIMGTAALKSNQMAGRQYEAMLCRGFRGKYHTSVFRILRWKDLSKAEKAVNILYGGIFLVLVIFFIYT